MDRDKKEKVLMGKLRDILERHSDGNAAQSFCGTTILQPFHDRFPTSSLILLNLLGSFTTQSGKVGAGSGKERG